jgi:hypothetical protein
MAKVAEGLREAEWRGKVCGFLRKIGRAGLRVVAGSSGATFWHQ